MRLLAIETSCDETAAAVVRDGTHLLSSVVSSQVELHARYGGVVPELASRQHLAAAAYASHLLPFEVMLLSMLLEQHKEVVRLRRQLEAIRSAGVIRTRPELRVLGELPPQEG